MTTEINTSLIHHYGDDFDDYSWSSTDESGPTHDDNRIVMTNLESMALPLEIINVAVVLSDIIDTNPRKREQKESLSQIHVDGTSELEHQKIGLSTDYTIETVTTTTFNSDINSSQSGQMLSFPEESIRRHVLKSSNECKENSALDDISHSKSKLEIPISSIDNSTSTTISSASNSSQSPSCAVEFATNCLEINRERPDKLLKRVVVTNNLSIASQTSSITNRSDENSMLTDEFRQTSLLKEVEEMKRKLNTMKINYYHQKCIRSLERCMVLYMKINASSHYDIAASSSTDSCRRDLSSCSTTKLLSK